MVWLRYPDPANPYAHGSWAGQALGDEIETDEYASKVQKAYFFNNATPAGIVSSEGLGQQQADKLRDDWESKFKGVLNAARIAFIGAKTTFSKITADFVDMGILELRKAKRDDFRGVYGVPPEILGITENSNRATAQAAQMIFALNTLVPRLDFRQDVLEQRLVPEFDEGLVLEYESPVPDDRDYDLKVFASQPAAFTLNEWRELAGRSPVDGFDDVYGGAPKGETEKPGPTDPLQPDDTEKP
jgi:HK97 family phage portal protein